MTQEQGTLQITLKKSLIGSCPKVRKTAHALGLRRIGQTVRRPDSESIRGMVRAIEFLVSVDEN
jgi:large subunit ribosomal protein L30